MHRIAVFLVAILTVAGLLPAITAADDVKLVKPVNLSVNTEADEDDPFLSSSGLTLWYASNAGSKFDIMRAQRRNVRSAWTKGKLLEDYVRTEVDDRGVSLTRDGVYPQYLYFATKKDKETKNFDIYVAVKQGTAAAFTEPTPVNAADTEADEINPWLTADAKQLYFSRKTKDGWRVYVCKRQQATGAQGFGEAVLVEDLPPGFHHVTLTRDGKTMYLQGPLEKERTGLFTASKTIKGWTKPEPLTILNHPEAKSDRAPALSADGSMLYFASDRPGGKGGFDLWVVPTAQLKGKK